MKNGIALNSGFQDLLRNRWCFKTESGLNALQSMFVVKVKKRISGAFQTMAKK